MWLSLPRFLAWLSVTAICGPANMLVGRKKASRTDPCAVVLTSTDEAGGQIVTVLPISHSPPSNPLLAVEIPAETKRRLGLDDDRSWVVLTEANRFVWPGPDLRPLRPGDAASVAYGPLPYGLFEDIRQKFIEVLKNRAASAVRRTE